MKLTTSMRALCAAVFLLTCLLAAAAPSALASGSKRMPALTPVGPDGLSRALARGEVTPAKYALERALSLFHPGEVAARYGTLAKPDPRSATMILRDLSIRLPSLPGADRERALSLLARPTDGLSDPEGDGYTVGEQTPVCGTHVCIHYVTSTADAVSTTDNGDGLGGPANGVPDYVDDALRVFDTEVWGKEVDTLGYRVPKSDMTSDNTGASSADLSGVKFDVYLAELGDKGFYGYCTTDDPHFVPDWDGVYQFFDASAYCVVDNDFTGFPRTPLEDLEVTAAHEFFHAVQAAYDWFEDRWIMEATATWMEDEVYTNVNDNLQYLVDGPLHKPSIPLDKGATNADPCCHVYGDWIFFRFLSETFNGNIVRSIWNRADASEDTDGGGPDGVGPDDFSVQAVSRVLSSRGGFRSRFAEFGWRNRISRVPNVYQEGTANHYPQAPLTTSNTLSKSSPRRSKSAKLKHQTNAYYEFKRGSGLSATAKLRVVLNLPSKSTGSAASALVFKKSGTVTPFTLGITSTGGGTFRLPFGSTVSKVDVILTNASTRYVGSSCFSFTTVYACGGAKPRDDGHTYAFTARAG